MSEQDREILLEAGLSAAKVAQLMGKSRQAVSKGISSPEDYFSSSELLWLAARAKEELPEHSERIHEAVGALFQRLADRVGASAPVQDGVGPAVAAAERLWLILPDYPMSYDEQPEAYLGLFSAIEARRPGTAVEPLALEVIIFCDKGLNAIERQFDDSWLAQRRMAFIRCDVVGQMMIPMLVVDPHRDDGRVCYALAADGFEPLAPAMARSRVSDFADQVTEKMRRVASVSASRLNMLTASPATLIEAGIERV